MMKKNNPLIVIVGPTASGKSALAVEVAKRINGEVVSADSMQIYQGMAIGSARVTEEEMMGVPHHMLNFVSPLDGYSVAQYRQDALHCIAGIHSRGKIPILCGGTGLYVNALLYPMAFSADAAGDPQIREALQAQLEREGIEALHARLAQVDPCAAQSIHKNNTRRVIRALEVYAITGKPFSSFIQDAYQERRLEFCVRAWVGLFWPKSLLDERIAQRVRDMFAQGLVEEVRALQRQGLTPEHQAMQGLGYRQVFPYLEGHASLEETIDEIILRTRQYAKRQMTWFRREKRIQWLDASGQDTAALAFRVLQTAQIGGKE